MAGSPHAKELEAFGAEVVAADLDDPASVEAAFAGAYAAYCEPAYAGARDPAVARELHPGLLSFRPWLSAALERNPR